MKSVKQNYINGKPDKPSISAAILVGGKSRRFGSDKALLHNGDNWIVDNLAKMLKDVFCEIYFISNISDKLDFLDYPVFEDIIPNKGPLGGLHTALSITKSDYIFLCACDLLLLDKDIIQYMIKHLNGQDVLVPTHHGHIEPTIAFYSRNCLATVEKVIDMKRLNIRSFYGYVNTQFLSFEGAFSDEAIEACFFNMNTQADKQKIREKLCI
jgi:molybdopterin-guanine dinucleotide biosynthesis protein A